MPQDYVRYAIWWVPQEATRLAAFGKRWTGWCADDGDSISLRMTRELPCCPPIGACEVTLLGLHGTLAAPFTLGPGRSIWRLEQALSGIAATMPSVPLPRLEVAVRDGRVVLAPARGSGMLERLQGRVADIVRLISGQSAGQAPMPGPIVPGGISLPSGSVLAPRLVEPFLMPLTIRMKPGEAERLAADLRPRLASLLAVPARVGDLALMADPGRGRRWRLIERYRLADEPLSARGREPAGMVCPDARPMPPLNAMMGSNWDTVIA